MVLNTLTVSAAVTPTVTKTYLSHYLNRTPLHQKPTAHISYDLGLHLVRRFVEYSALHTVEELQAFTAQWVPAPSWVRVEDVEIPGANVERAAELLQSQLGQDGIESVGGREWWKWRRGEKGLWAEWIEMKSDWNARKANGNRGNRVMLYVHGGAYYFGSVNEHRYQIQRHARKLKAKCLAPKYRLAPQVN
jgi:acetyl esterase/lipase